MRQPIPTLFLLALPLLAACATSSTPPAPSAITAPAAQAQAESPAREEDEYSRYELLEPGLGAVPHSLRGHRDRAGATVYFNPIRKGSAASDESVRDRATGQPLSAYLPGFPSVRVDYLIDTPACQSNTENETRPD
ncbi:MAG: hypothetical protein ABUT39_17805 [Acidobacteriota bacterium]